MKNKVVDIENQFSVEIDRIKYILSGLENGYVYELTGVQGHGAIATNVSNLKKELNDLFRKIQYGETSDLYEMSDLFSTKENTE
ncbi:hypothetical protein [Sporosarcina psychrophila]|uniref:Uncharacterized protein n=1 Tax=Sporosarcina psychrophila TaxID=1476 RepID=A0ABV2K9P9_SPOPS